MKMVILPSTRRAVTIPVTSEDWQLRDQRIPAHFALRLTAGLEKLLSILDDDYARGLRPIRKALERRYEDFIGVQFQQLGIDVSEARLRAFRVIDRIVQQWVIHDDENTTLVDADRSNRKSAWELLLQEDWL